MNTNETTHTMLALDKITRTRRDARAWRMHLDVVVVVGVGVGLIHIDVLLVVLHC